MKLAREWSWASRSSVFGIRDLQLDAKLTPLSPRLGQPICRRVPGAGACTFRNPRGAALRRVRTPGFSQLPHALRSSGCAPGRKGSRALPLQTAAPALIRLIWPAKASAAGDEWADVQQRPPRMARVQPSPRIVLRGMSLAIVTVP